MNIAIIGTGHVGTTLGASWSERHSVWYGSRDPARAREKAASAEVKPLGEACQGADLVLLAVPSSALEETCRQLGVDPGTLLLDATNNVEGTPAGRSSNAELVQRLLPSAKVAKSFNTCGFPVLADPRFGEIRADMYVAGHTDAKAAAGLLAREMGFGEIVDCGGLEGAQILEHLARGWIALGRGVLGYDYLLKMVTRGAQAS